jgi:hypothetical protein
MFDALTASTSHGGFMIFLMYGLAWFVTGATIAWVFGRMVQAANMEDGGLLLN